MPKPIFEHRHYVAIAACLAQSMARSNVAHDTIKAELARMFAQDNSRFDVERFFASCNGTPSNGRDKVR